MTSADGAITEPEQLQQPRRASTSIIGIHRTALRQKVCQRAYAQQVNRVFANGQPGTARAHHAAIARVTANICDYP